jgi:hypothetical protein
LLAKAFANAVFSFYATMKISVDYGGDEITFIGSAQACASVEVGA